MSERKLTIGWPILTGLVLVALLTAGCTSSIETQYGQRKGSMRAGSVNGTGVLGEMFQQAGHKVFSWHLLSPKLHDRADCIVWFPDDFKPPGDDVLEWLQLWLEDRPDRTLIYVARGFDAAGFYWGKVEPEAPEDQVRLVQQQKTDANSTHQRRRPVPTQTDECDWFTVQHVNHSRQVRTLQGDPNWYEEIDASQLEIELLGRIVAPDSAERLLESEGDVLITREEFYDSQLIVVANGSFLLNLPLVNHEHRKLAGKLIEAVGPPQQTVVFLESSSSGPKISEKDPQAQTPSGYELFFVYPLIFAHLALLGLIFCFSRWPIFGIPRELEPPPSADFGKHIEALGDLLRRTGDRAHAITRLKHYQQTDV